MNLSPFDPAAGPALAAVIPPNPALGAAMSFAQVAAAPRIDIDALRRHRDVVHVHAGNVLRMVAGRQAGDGSYSPPVVRLTLDAARNAYEAALADLDVIEAEVVPAGRAQAAE